MKFKQFALIFVLLLTTTHSSWGGGVICHPFLGLNIEALIKTVSGSGCYENRNLEDDTKEICECLGRTTSKIKNFPNGNFFNNRMMGAVQKNVLFLVNNKMNAGGDTNGVKTFIEALPEESPTQKIVSEELKVKNEKYNYCGFTIDDFRRISRIPAWNLIEDGWENQYRDDEGNLIKGNPHWDNYLKANPDIMAIHVNLKEDKQSEFKKKILDEFNAISKSVEDGRTLLEKKNDPDDKTASNDSKARTKAEKKLQRQIDASFYPGGNLSGILTEYSKLSSGKQLEDIKNVNSFLNEENGFEITYKNVLGNPEVWDLFFNKENPDGKTCSSSKAKTISLDYNSQDYDALSCVENVSGFCRLYDETKDKRTKKKQLKKVENLDLKSLLAVDKSYDQSIEEYHKEGHELCSTEYPVNHLFDKSNKAFTGNLDFKK